MPAVARLGDTCTGHASFPPRPSIEGSGNVFVNGLSAHRRGDGWAAHCNPSPSCHAGSLAGGSGTVYVNGRPLGRIGDMVDCGSAAAQGSPNVHAGG